MAMDQPNPIDDDENDLFDAVRHDDLDRVNQDIKAGIPCDEPNRYGVTPLFIAAHKGYHTVVETLLAHGANPNRADSIGLTPLHIAARKGFADVVHALLEKGAQPNKSDKAGETPLYLAAKHKHPEVIKTLLHHGAKPHKFPSNGIKSPNNIHLFFLEKLKQHPKDAQRTIKIIQDGLEDIGNPHKKGWMGLLYKLTRKEPKDPGGAIIADLLAEKRYKNQNFDEALLTSFYRDLKSRIDLDALEPDNELYQMIELTKHYADIDVYQL